VLPTSSARTSPDIAGRCPVEATPPPPATMPGATVRRTTSTSRRPSLAATKVAGQNHHLTTVDRHERVFGQRVPYPRERGIDARATATRTPGCPGRARDWKSARSAHMGQGLWPIRSRTGPATTRIMGPPRLRLSGAERRLSLRSAAALDHRRVAKRGCVNVNWTRVTGRPTLVGPFQVTTRTRGRAAHVSRPPGISLLPSRDMHPRPRRWSALVGRPSRMHPRIPVTRRWSS